MDSVRNELQQQLNSIEKYLQQLETRKRKYKNAPVGNIRVSYNGGRPQYLFKGPNDKNEHYVVKQDYEKLKVHIQYDYEAKLFKCLKASQRRISRFLASYDDKVVQHAYDRLCDGRKRMIDPIEIPDEEYIRQWLASHPGSKNPYPAENSFLTDRGESVRSKSEKIIADLLYRLKIPYQYESSLILDGKYIVYPDFMMLDVKKRRTVYLEHFGLLSDSVYALKALKRIGVYEKNGIIAGDNFIISLESGESPLDIKLLEKIIRKMIDIN